MTLQELFAKDGTWTQGAYARDKSGQVIDETNAGACAFCLDGAISAYVDSIAKRIEIRQRIRGHLRVRSLSRWNDDPVRIIKDVRKLVAELNL